MLLDNNKEKKFKTSVKKPVGSGMVSWQEDFKFNISNPPTLLCLKVKENVTLGKQNKLLGNVSIKIAGPLKRGEIKPGQQAEQWVQLLNTSTGSLRISYTWKP